MGRGDALHEHINYDPGTHNFERDNREAHYKVIGQHWFSGETNYVNEEIDSAREVKTADELAVDLPADNLDLQQLAQQLMTSLPRIQAAPGEAKKAAAWQAERRETLARALRAGKHQPLPLEYKVTANEVKRHTVGEHQVISWQLKIGDTWTIPAMEFAPLGATSMAIVLSDGGRTACAEQIEKLLAAHCQVIALDPFYFGESKIKNKDFLFALLVSSVGERPLGVQASQLGAVARWLAADRKITNLKLIAHGPRTSLIGLAAAAMEDKAITSVELIDSRGSLKEIIEQGGAVNTTPEQFCFGLLEAADIRDLAMLVAPRKLTLHFPSDRAKTDFASLKDWYELLGHPFDPLAPKD
jgi:hypothetical protein